MGKANARITGTGACPPGGGVRTGQQPVLQGSGVASCFFSPVLATSPGVWHHSRPRQMCGLPLGAPHWTMVLHCDNLELGNLGCLAPITFPGQMYWHAFKTKRENCGLNGEDTSPHGHLVFDGIFFLGFSTWKRILLQNPSPCTLLPCCLKEERTF